MLDRILTAAGRTRPDTRAMLAIAALLCAFAPIAARVRLHPASTAIVCAGLSFALLGLVLRRLRLDSGTIGIVLAGYGLYLSYLGYTTIGERNYDGPVQLDYIKYIVEHRAIPPGTHCFICHHPPLYYTLGALVYALCQATRAAQPVVGLQIFSLAISMVLVVYGILTVRRLTSDVRRIRLAAALIVFWPYGIHNSVRVHNDTLACALMAVAAYHLVAWHQEDRPRHLYLAGLSVALGILTKSNAYALVPVLLALLCARLFRSRDRLRLLGRAGLVGLLLAASLTASSLVRKKGPETSEGFCQKIAGSACNLNPSQYLENEPYNYLYFDVRSFLKEPYLLVEREETGRSLFWNDLVKSSLFGTHNRTPDRETAYEVNRRVAAVMNALALAMVGYLAAAAATARVEGLRRYAVVMGTLGSLLAFMIGFRVLAPAPHHTDFRHVFSSVVLVSALYVAAIDHFERRGLALARLGAPLAAAFVALSVLYFAPKHALVMKWTARVVTYQAADFAKPVPEGAQWDREGNLTFEANHTVELSLREQDVERIDISLDGNDRYEIRLYGRAETRRIVLGPSARKGEGLARFVQAVDPPVQGVRKIGLAALSGDMAYSMGHVIVQ